DRGISCTFGADVVAEIRPFVVEDGYEFFAKRRLVTIFSAPNYGWEFDNAGALSSVDQSLVCSFEILKPAPSSSGIALKKTSGYMNDIQEFEPVVRPPTMESNYPLLEIEEVVAGGPFLEDLSRSVVPPKKPSIAEEPATSLSPA
ncbi:hypothetical protein HID58_018826, partial [Brassica napus]